MAMLNAVHRFFIPALSPAMFNVATILFALWLVPAASRAGVAPILVIALGTLAGGIGQVMLQWPALRREGFRYRPTLDLNDPGLRQIVRLIGPGVGGLAAVQVNLFVNSWLATSLGTGAVSWLDYAFRLMYMPIGLFGISIATAALPGIARHAAANDEAGVRRDVSTGLRMMLVLNIPAATGLSVLALPIVTLIFEHGRFTHADAVATAAALTCYAPGLVGYSTVKLISPVFYSLGSAREPLVASAASVAVNIALNLILVRVLGHRGLALGTSIAALCNALILLWMLRERLGRLEGQLLATASAKIAVASVIMAASALLAERALHVPFYADGIFARGVRVFGAIAAGLITLVGAAQLLRIRELTETARAILGRFAQPSEI